MSPRQEENS